MIKEDLKKCIESRAFSTKDSVNIVDKGGERCNWIFDIKGIVLDPCAISWIVDMFWQKFEDEYPFQIGGLETTSIPIIAGIVYSSAQRGKPVNGFYIRKSKKKDGLQRDIEGKIEKNIKIIIIDDIINSGRSVMRQLEVLKSEGVVNDVTGIFTLINFRRAENYHFLSDRKIKLRSVFSIEDFGKKYLETKSDIPYRHFEEIWKFSSLNHDPYYVLSKSNPVMDSERIYFGSDQGIFWALEQKDGSVAWRRRIGLFRRKGIFSSPVLFEDKIFFGGYDGNFYCLDKNNGRIKWVSMEADWIGSSPCVADDLGLVFIGLEFASPQNKGGVIALDIATGETVWRVDVKDYVHASPAYCKWKSVVLCGSNDGFMRCFDAMSGNLVWEYQTGGDIKFSCVFDKERNIVAFGSFDGFMYILDLDSGLLKFKFHCQAGIASNQIIERGNIFLSSLDKCVYSLNLDSYKLNWNVMTDGRIFSSPSIIDGNVFVGSNDGRMYEIDSNTGDIAAAFQSPERITSRILYNYDTKRFFVYTGSNQMLCLVRQGISDRFAGN